jgi:hypothetical protein
LRHRDCRSRATRGSPIKSRAEWTLRFANTVFRRTPSAKWSATLRNTAVIPQLSMLAVVVLVSTLLFARGAPDLKAVLPVAAFAALFLTYVAFVSPKRLHRRRSRLWDTYVLEIGSDRLLRQGDTPDVQLSFAEIRSIERRPGHGLRGYRQNPVASDRHSRIHRAIRRNPRPGHAAGAGYPAACRPPPSAPT